MREKTIEKLEDIISKSIKFIHNKFDEGSTRDDIRKYMKEHPKKVGGFVIDDVIFGEFPNKEMTQKIRLQPELAESYIIDPNLTYKPIYLGSFELPKRSATFLKRFAEGNDLDYEKFLLLEQDFSKIKTFAWSRGLTIVLSDVASAKPLTYIQATGISNPVYSPTQCLINYMAELVDIKTATVKAFLSEEGYVTIPDARFIYEMGKDLFDLREPIL